MHIIVVGLSHKTAPVEIREKLTFPLQDQEGPLQHLVSYESIAEGVILSTCNRTEIYVLASDLNKGKADILNFLSSFCDLDQDKILNYLYFKHQEKAVHHLFMVVSSLDSMVVGEAQILGQVKDAYQCAFENQATSTIFNRLFRETLSVGKKVRTETGIGENAVSISYAAVQLAKKVFGNLNGHTVLVMGAGEMSELTAQHLMANGVNSVLVTNRTHERAVDLAKKFNGKAIGFDDYHNYLQDADIVISSTGAPHYVIHRDVVAEAMRKRKNKPIFFIDIAVPRDIEPEVGELYNVFLYDIDDLQSVVNTNLAERNKEAVKAKRIIDKELNKFISWVNSLEVVPTISALKREAEEIRASETEKILSKMQDISSKDKNLINTLTSAIVNKLLHKPIVSLKESSNRKDGYIYTESARYLFGLNDDENEEQ
ncbi:glutamyl-tRNA reductase [Candidatus Oleimmundimicrobium sp.]|uniref:glutamyl-tRNA reductase n=1 Tax=Candidatus Oleimmundimicrobium sp. TaxID=3060597 RepID=UPI002721B28D|nr:glutamyl-tRNA reductase [Candidatus Oleimmundimicrobium sp.]MDO8885939.1 glutamyl-tRNA reductase [Candidatus Oleimmundimicrobium sp.]